MSQFFIVFSDFQATGEPILRTNHRFQSLRHRREDVSVEQTDNMKGGAARWSRWAAADAARSPAAEARQSKGLVTYILRGRPRGLVTPLHGLWASLFHVRSLWLVLLQLLCPWCYSFTTEGGKKWLSLDAVLHTWNSHKCCGSGKCLELFPNSRKRAYFYRFAQISFFNFSLPEAMWTKSLRAINDTYRLWSQSRTKPPQGPFEVLRLPLRWKRIHMD